MHYSFPLITTIALSFALALVMGFIAVRFKIPSIVGYLLAGVIIGPFTPGVFGDLKIAQELAEIGVMLLMFGVGLHFSLEDLLRVRGIAIPGAIVQIMVATVFGAAAAKSWGWGYTSAIMLGLSLSVASTVVLLRALEERNALETINGHIAVGWLLVEDLVIVVVLVLLPSLSHWVGSNPPMANATQPIWLVLCITLLKVAAFITLMLLVGKRLLPKLLWQIARTGSRELFTLCTIAAAISIAYGASKLFGVSFALGAFFAGMILRESTLSHRAAEESLPLRDAFAVLFFVSVGMLFNPDILLKHPVQVLMVIGIITVGKSFAAFILVLIFRYPLQTALIVSASLAQIGEFSFILADIGVRLGMLTEDGRSLILAGALISIAFNPLIFRLIGPVESWVKAHPRFARLFIRSEDPLAQLPMTTNQEYLSGQVVLVGYGRIGKRVVKLLLKKAIPVVVVDENRESIDQLRACGIPAVYGDGSEALVLVQAHIAHASLLMILVPRTLDVRRMIKTALSLNPDIEIVVRTHDEEEAKLLQGEVPGKVFFVEGEIAKNIGSYVLERFNKQT